MNPQSRRDVEIEDSDAESNGEIEGIAAADEIESTATV
jgi:hypothetical protein